MDIHAYFSRHPLLKQHISYYYFFKTDDPQFSVNYYSFPNLTTPLNIHKNIDTKISSYTTSIFESKTENSVLLVQGMRKYPLLVNLNGKLDKITIHFKPLGLNHFIKKPFIEIAQHDSQLFTEWNNEPGYKNFISAFYATNELENRVNILEEFLLSVYTPLDIDPIYEKAVSMLTDFTKETSIEQIAKELKTSTRTLDRFFNKHIGISPVGFKKIARFRHSLDNKLLDQHNKTLTDISYESNFYDQAYFINVYKQIAGSNPSTFFKTISKLADDRLVFQFLDTMSEKYNSL
ncbi:helix-turn-helix domain-containing protein [Mucilaginibacter sp.]|uniref:helix-turn-helix domain-containing protein n=1 Tax=Mucilaginibacter sp. TaxID=1882438 RepID=UPI00261FE26F|nr:helix-turn-helix domain-containing protein [Mucilaginibacter sp.]MDB5030851.1 AraC family transcriptional regulator [Mucilaginibacter sp.]